MNNVAIIQNGIVVNLIVINGDAVVLSDIAEIGDTYDGTNFNKPQEIDNGNAPVQN